MLSINRKLNSLFRNTLFKNSTNKLLSTESDEPVERREPINFRLTEELPPIPPNYGWIGDDNFKSLFEMKKIRDSFKHGNPPRMKRRFIKGPPVIRLLPIQSCSNRKFYRLAVQRLNCEPHDPFIEDLGSIDPMPNKDNQILVALNIERIKYYLSKSVPIKGSVGPILGLAGFLPVHPSTYLKAYRNRKKLNETSIETEKKKENGDGND